MKKWIDLAFDVGDTVYLKTDKEQLKRIVTAICVKQNGSTYELSLAANTSWHFDFEMSSTIDVLAKVTYTND